MSLAQRIRPVRYSFALLLFTLIVVITTLAMHRSMDDALLLLLISYVAFVLFLSIITRRWIVLLLPSTFIGILGLAIGLRGPSAHGWIDALLNVALDISLGCFIAAGFWFRWKDRRSESSRA